MYAKRNTKCSINTRQRTMNKNVIIFIAQNSLSNRTCNYHRTKCVKRSKFYLHAIYEP